MSDLPICECANYYGTGKHHPECPVRHEIKRLRASCDRYRRIARGRMALAAVQETDDE